MAGRWRAWGRLLLALGAAGACPEWAAADGQIAIGTKVQKCDANGGSRNPTFSDFDQFAPGPAELTHSVSNQETCKGRLQRADGTAEVSSDRSLASAKVNVSATEGADAVASGFLNAGPYVTVNSGPVAQALTVVVLLDGVPGTRSFDCLEEDGSPSGAYPCVTARFQPLASHRVKDSSGRRVDDIFVPVNGEARLLIRVPVDPGAQEVFAVGGLAYALVGGGTSDIAQVKARFLYERAPGLGIYDFTGTQAAVPRLPSAQNLLEAGDAIPGALGLRISPPSGVVTLRQGFDLAVLADTGGVRVTDVTGTLDGVDVSGPLRACLQPAGRLTGPVAGEVRICPGLSGGFLGPGERTLRIVMTLEDARTLTDQVTWSVRP